VIYNWINSNRRDSPIWQRGFLTAGGADKLKEFWDEEGSDQEPKGGVSEVLESRMARNTGTMV